MPENSRLYLAERPTADIIPGKTFVREAVPMPSPADLKDGEVLLEHLYCGIDPAMRNWLNDDRSWIAPVKIGETMYGTTLARVLASKSVRVAPGDLVMSYMHSWINYRVCAEPLFETLKTDLPPVSDPRDVLSLHGATGLSAYVGMNNIAAPKAGELVVVSAAAGSTGSMAGQIAKILGARVVGIAGTKEKCRWIKEELGFDVALNYKDDDYEQKFLEATKDLIDVYYDNVGGQTLDMALGQAKPHARFVVSGMISQYNSKGEPYPLKNLMCIFNMRITMTGFIFIDHAAEFPQARQQLGKWNAEGKIKLRTHVAKGGLDAAEKALTDVFKGVNTGRMVLEIKDIEEPSAVLGTDGTAES